jgi:hypothetical protein
VIKPPPGIFIEKKNLSLASVAFSCLLVSRILLGLAERTKKSFVQ